ncbi:AAA family ATPase [Streptantibioticus parmotrematis]|uniref:AAA family ATPase n=1 Tax=Streptantibioticus parmotrematis TaxID=2873249 RepID=UPI0027E0109C|nr:MoxR family ATPase [Streptantibioticus parmotrematis]
MTPQETHVRSAAVLDELERVVVGKRRALELVWCGILASGHVLIEDLPGLGKTLIARSFAAALGLSFTRLQFTPDMLPADVTGASVYDRAEAREVFRPGPLFTQLLLADEINRTPPKTQAALLEAMGEGQVSVDGHTHALPRPFVVLATDNPIEYEGTYPLPEAQLDRFALRVRLGYLTADEERAMLRRRLERGTPEGEVAAVTSAEELLAMRESLERVEVDDDLLAYVVELLAATRDHPEVAVGASPRGGLALVQLARAHATLDGRDFVVPEDLHACAGSALGHRISLRPELWVRQVTGDDVIRRLLERLPAPGPERAR